MTPEDGRDGQKEILEDGGPEAERIFGIQVKGGQEGIDERKPDRMNSLVIVLGTREGSLIRPSTHCPMSIPVIEY